MSWLLMIPIIVQGGVIFFDEFYFHHKRGLPKWEVFGHPLDTLTVIGCLAFVLLVDFSMENFYIYCGIAILSCLFITKDEAVHAEFCEPSEQWLHAILFILHPLVLMSFAGMWYFISKGDLQKLNFLYGQLAILLTFVTYQIMYWGYYEPRKCDQQQSLS